MPIEAKPDPLSDVPSVAILQALEDLEACERDPRYRINMTVYHRPVGAQCNVCLAGSVMAKRYAAPISKLLHTNEFGTAANMLRALDCLRTGDVASALHELLMQCTPEREKLSKRVTPYNRDPAAFKSDMRKLAALLAEHGL